MDLTHLFEEAVYVASDKVIQRLVKRARELPRGSGHASTHNTRDRPRETCAPVHRFAVKDEHAFFGTDLERTLCEQPSVLEPFESFKPFEPFEPFELNKE